MTTETCQSGSFRDAACGATPVTHVVTDPARPTYRLPVCEQHAYQFACLIAHERIVANLTAVDGADVGAVERIQRTLSDRWASRKEPEPWRT